MLSSSLASASSNGLAMTGPVTLAELSWLFCCDNRNRGIIRQNFDEAALLWRAVSLTQGDILEVGRRHGGTTVLLVSASAGRRVMSLDIAPAHHPMCEAFFSMVMASQPERLDLRIGDSRVPVEGGAFGMLFIDGDHSYDGVRADTIAHWGSLSGVNGAPGYAIYHDAVPNDGLAHKGLDNHCEGVLRLCEELIEAGCARLVAHAGSSVLLEKCAELPERWRA